MARTDEPIDVITGVRGIGGERKREAPLKKGGVARKARPGNDSVTISPRARRLADIEGFLGTEPDEEKPKEDAP